MKINTLKNYSELSITVANIVEKQIAENPESRLVLPTGSTPLGMYEELVKRDMDWSNVTIFNLDVYLIDANHPQNYQAYMKKNLFSKINIREGNYHFPSQATADFEEKMAESTGIDLCILGIGGNGHIAFNEPGSSFDSRTRAVDLTKETMDDNSRLFASIEDVPTQAITMGLGTIMESKKILLLANGKHKSDILDKAANGEITEDIPASVLQQHNNAEAYYCD